MKKENQNRLGFWGVILIGVTLYVFFSAVVTSGNVGELLDFASTPYPTAISGGQQDNEQVSNNTNSIVLHVAPTTPPIQPTERPTATPAPTATPQPTATQQATATAVWGYVVETLEPLQERIEALENRPTPQAESIGFIHYGTTGVTLLIGVIVWGILRMAGKQDFNGPLLAQNSRKHPVTPHNVTVTQHTAPVTPDNKPVTVDNWAVTREATRQKIANQHERGVLIALFPSPSPYAFTALQKRQLQELSAAGVSKRDLMNALWGRGGSLSKPAIDRALEDR